MDIVEGDVQAQCCTTATSGTPAEWLRACWRRGRGMASPMFFWQRVRDLSSVQKCSFTKSKKLALGIEKGKWEYDEIHTKDSENK